MVGTSKYLTNIVSAWRKQPFFFEMTVRWLCVATDSMLTIPNIQFTFDMNTKVIGWDWIEVDGARKFFSLARNL